jgi:5-methylcytosine-specific restriction endonuclease McrA
MDEFNDIMNDYWIADRTLSWEEQREITGKLPREPNMDVDHITPVAQGGDMWEESNLQCLCTECHREKTNNDLKFIKKYKKGDGDVGNFLKKEEKK